MYGKRRKKNKQGKEKIIKDITKKNTVDIVVKNPVECYKQKLTLPHKRE